MSLFSTSKIEERILEVQGILNSEGREAMIVAGVPQGEFSEGLLKKANKSLLTELEDLKVRRQFARDNQQIVINTVSIIVALLIAFLVPIISK